MVAISSVDGRSPLKTQVIRLGQNNLRVRAQWESADDKNQKSGSPWDWIIIYEGPIRSIIKSSFRPREHNAES